MKNNDNKVLLTRKREIGSFELYYVSWDSMRQFELS